jgi:hypothetical protein
VVEDPLGRPLEAIGSRTTATLNGGHRVRVSADGASPVASGPFRLKVTCRFRPRRATLTEPE